MKPVAISVIMPVFNTKEEYLKQAIESILNQTFKDFEFIIINDGSTNNAEEIILSYDDPRIKYIKNEYNLKLIKTLNKGLSLASGKYIARLDADDTCTEERLQKQFDYMEEHPNIGLLGTFITLLPEQKKLNLITDSKQLKIILRYGKNCLTHSSVMIRKSILDKYNLKYGEYCLHAEDYKLWTEMVQYCDVTNLPEYLVSYRLSPTGICATHQLEQQKMTSIIVLDNIINDFDCNKEFMYSILTKYTKEQELTKLEYYAIEKLFIEVIKYVKANLDTSYQIPMINRLLKILKDLNRPRRNH